MKTPHTILAGLILAAGLLAIEAPGLVAGRNEGPRMEPTRSVRNAPTKKALATKDPLRLTGTLRFDNRSGLQLDQQSILISPQTVVFPREEARRLDPRRLHGRTAMVFGVQTQRGIRATMVLLESKPDWTAPADNIKPSSSDPRAGEFVDEGS